MYFLDTCNYACQCVSVRLSLNLKELYTIAHKYICPLEGEISITQYANTKCVFFQLQLLKYHYCTRYKKILSRTLRKDSSY